MKNIIAYDLDGHVTTCDQNSQRPKGILTENAMKFVQRGVKRPVTSKTMLEIMMVLK